MVKKIVLMVAMVCVLGGARAWGMDEICVTDGDGELFIPNIKDRKNEGKFHLGIILTAIIGCYCNVPYGARLKQNIKKHRYHEWDLREPLDDLVRYMTGKQNIYDSYGEKLFANCRDFFYKQYTGLEEFIKKNKIEDCVSRLEGSSIAKLGGINKIYEKVGQDFFKLDSKLSLGSDAYYLSVKKNCLKNQDLGIHQKMTMWCRVEGEAE